MRRTALAFLVALLFLTGRGLLPAAAQAFGVSPVAAGHPSGRLALLSPIADPLPARAAVASGLAFRQECSSTTATAVRVTFGWVPSQEGQQWLDLSLTNNGFQPGTFIGAGPFSPTTASYAWDGLQANAAHFARVNTLTYVGWQSSETLSFRTLPCGATANPSVANPDLLALRDRLQAEVNQSGINAAVAVSDLQTGESIAVNGDDQRLSGCTINLFVLMRVVMDLQEGRYPESLVGDLISRTVYSSNPVTARDLLLISRGGDLGAAMLSVNDLMRLLGLEASIYDHPPAYPSETLWGYPDVLTANDTNRALAGLWGGSVLRSDWRDYLLQKLTGVKPGLQYLIPAGVGNGVVSHKNGFFWSSGGWIDNDAGIVTFQRGGQRYAYAVSFFTQNVSSKYADIPLGQTVSRLVWQYFDSRYR